MPNKKVTELPVATSVGPTDVLLVVQGGVTKQVSQDTVAASLSTTYVPLNPGFDIVLLAGQSNMAGYSEAVTALNGTTLDRVNPTIFQWGTHGTTGIKAAAEPLDMYDTPPGIGPGLQFARRYANKYLAPSSRKVLLVPAAKGGTPFEGASSPTGFTWKVGRTDVTNLYTNLKTQALAAKAAADAISGTVNRFIAVLWLQGESDGDNGTTGQTYRTDFEALLTQLRADLALPTLPILVGTMVPEYLSTGTRTVIDAVHKMTPVRIPLVDVAIGATGMNKGDGNHYSQAGQRANGLAFFNAYERIVQGLAPTYTDYTPGQPVASVSSPSATSLLVAWPAAANAVSYLVEYRVTAVGGTWTSGGTSTGTSKTLTGLSTGTQYDVRVTATNLIGDVGTPSTAATGTPTAPPPPAVSDTFTRSNSTTALGTSDTGQTWTAASGTWGISSNTAYSVTAVDGDRAIINTGKTDQTVSAVITGSTGTNPSLLARMTDGSNGYVLAVIPGSTAMKFYKIVAGTYTQLGSNLFPVTIPDGATVGFSVIGTTLTAYVNGASVGTVSDSTFTTGTYAGLRVGGSSAALRYDNFTVA